ncbi:hypothetical protein [Flexivirga sp. B27]
MTLRTITTSIVTAALLSAAGFVTASADAAPATHGVHASASAASQDNPIWDDTTPSPVNP